MSLKTFFVYEVDFTALAPAASITQNFQVNAQTDFFLQKLTFIADIAFAAQTESSVIVPLVTVDIINTATSQHLSSAAMPLVNIAGSGQLPFIFPAEYVFPRNTLVNVTLTNYSSVTTYNLRLSFIGFSLYGTKDR